VNRALVEGAAGMAAQQAALDAISSNLANVDTPGFRATRPEFAELIGSDGAALGTGPVAARTLFIPGRLESTGDEHDLAIAGEGFFRVKSRDGRAAYTRAGNFTPDSHGRLALPNGATLDGVRLPSGTTRMDVSPDGAVVAHVAGNARPMRCGYVHLHAFDDVAALQQGDDGMYYATASAGADRSGRPGIGGFGRLEQRYLERANVSVVDEMMSILAAQRAYEANAKTVQAADEMLRLANNLEKG